MGDEDEPHEVVCAWCETRVSDGRQPVSHGICSDCLQDLLFAITRSQLPDEAAGGGESDLSSEGPWVSGPD